VEVPRPTPFCTSRVTPGAAQFRVRPRCSFASEGWCPGWPCRLAGLTDAGRAKMFAFQSCLSLIGLQVLAMTPKNPAVVVAALVTTMVGAAPMIFLAPGALIARFASKRFNGTMVGLNDAPGFLTSMLVLKFYPMMLARGGWAMPMRLMQLFAVAGGIANWTVWQLEASNPTRHPIV
jgi:hypothetical protein